MTRHPESSIGAPVVNRDVVRIVLRDIGERVLLVHIRDGSNPDFGTSWELPGGGIEPGESWAEAAVRELREETGLSVSPKLIGPPTWERDAAYTYRGERRVQQEFIVAAKLPYAAPLVRPTTRAGFEGDDHFEYRWWRLDEILTSADRFYPRSLPQLLTRFLSGEIIVESFESWP